MIVEKQKNYRRKIKQTLIHVIVIACLFNILLIVHYFLGISGNPLLKDYLIMHNFHSADLLIFILLALHAEGWYQIYFGKYSLKKKILCMILFSIILQALFLLFLVYQKQTVSYFFLLLQVFSFQLIYSILYLFIRGKIENEFFIVKKELNRNQQSLALLQSQINPHFFFNNINSLLATALAENASSTAEGLTLFAELMRFNIQTSKNDFVKLIDEINFIDNYIHLQSLRIPNNNELDIRITDEIPTNSKIACMVLYPFIENAFKYGISTNEITTIKIHIQIKNSNNLELTVINSDFSHLSHKGKGIGIKLTKERLKLLYPNKHELIILNDNLQHQVHLSINLN